MRILNVLDFSPMAPGGMVSLLEALGRIARESGHEVVFAFPHARGWQASHLSAETRVFVIPQIVRPLRSGFPRVLRSLCRERAIDLVHLHFSFALPFSLAWSITPFPVPVVYHWHNPPKALCQSQGDTGGRHAWVKSRLGNLVARVTDNRVIKLHIAISEEIRRLLVDHRWAPQGRVRRIPNGIGVPPKRSVTQEDRLGRHRVIGAVANFRPQKDHDTLVRAFHILTRMDLDADLWMVGDGPTRRSMERLVEELGLDERVRFFGAVSETERFYRRFDAFVLSSHFEGHPLVLLEAMGHGLPIVATKASSIPETVSEGSEALLVSPRSPQAMASALQRVLSDHALRDSLGENARSRVERDYSVEGWARSIIGCYEEFGTTAGC